MDEIIVYDKSGKEVWRGGVNDYYVVTTYKSQKERRSDSRFNREIVRPTYDTVKEGLNPKGPKYL